MSGLILPQGIDRAVVLEPVNGLSCEPVRVAANILTTVIGELDPMSGEGGPSIDLSTYEGQLTSCYTQVASACGHLCSRACGLWVELNADIIGLEVPVSEPERSRRDMVIKAISLGIDDTFKLSGPGQLAKAIIERRIEVASDTPEFIPKITDEAYEQVATLAEGSHAVEIKIIGMLVDAARNEGKHLVTPEDLARITASDVRLLFSHPKMQYLLRLMKTPRSEMLTIQSR